MIILLSPAKTLNFETPVATKNATTPQFTKQAAQLMKALREQTADDLSKLMKLSDELGALNFERNQQWKTKPDPARTKPAVYAFQGDVYQGLAADDLSAAEVRRCQKHVRILSGLYGILRPLDLIQPYRLEMATKLKTKAGKNLYEFWDDTIHKAIGEQLTQLKSRLVVNLASNEYSRVAKLKSLDADVVTPVFKDWKNGRYKVIGFFAKRARGTMTRYLITNSVTRANDIKEFNLDGYTYDASLSSETEPVFTRKT